MRLAGKHLSNIIFVAFLALFFLTPLGFRIRVFVSNIIAFSPSELAVEEKKVLKDYDWRLTDATGRPFLFERVKGKVVVLNHWATWCPPCVAEMPEFQPLYTSKKEEVTFLFVANDEKIKVDAFMQKNGFSLPVFYGLTKAPDLLFAKAIPTTFSIDRKGKIHMKKTGAANWDSEPVHDLLNSLISEPLD